MFIVSFHKRIINSVLILLIFYFGNYCYITSAYLFLILPLNIKHFLFMYLLITISSEATTETPHRSTPVNRFVAFNLLSNTATSLRGINWETSNNLTRECAQEIFMNITKSVEKLYININFTTNMSA